MSVQGQIGSYQHPELFTPERLALQVEASDTNGIYDRAFGRGHQKGQEAAEIDEYGIHNGERFRRDSPAAIRRAEIAGRPVGLVLSDADDMKAVNDEFGHAEGDKIIDKTKSVWRDIREEFAARGVPITVARIGGDEFAALVYGDEEQTRLVAEEYKKRYRKPDQTQEDEPKSENNTTSVGYAHLSEGLSKFSNLMRIADKRMYKDKIDNLGPLSRRDRLCLHAARMFIMMSSPKKRRLRDAPKYWRAMHVLD